MNFMGLMMQFRTGNSKAECARGAGSCPIKIREARNPRSEGSTIAGCVDLFRKLSAIEEAPEAVEKKCGDALQAGKFSIQRLTGAQAAE